MNQTVERQVLIVL